MSNKQRGSILIIIITIVLLLLAFAGKKQNKLNEYNDNRTGCIQKIQLVLGGEHESYYKFDAGERDGFGRPIPRKFKTQEEAVTYCMSLQN